MGKKNSPLSLGSIQVWNVRIECYVVTAGCSIEMKSYGCCDVRPAYVKLNGVAVWEVSTIEEFSRRRGVNIIPMNSFNCSSRELRHFDTFGWTSAATQLSDYLQQLDNGSVIVGVTVDDARYRLDDALPILQRFGVDVADLQFRGTFAFIAQKGFPAKTVFRKVLTQTESRSNPAQFNATITGMRALWLITAISAKKTFQFRTQCKGVKSHIQNCRDHFGENTWLNELGALTYLGHVTIDA